MNPSAGTTPAIPINIPDRRMADDDRAIRRSVKLI